MKTPFKFLVLLILITSCGANVNYDYAKNTKFSEYKTYNYFTDIKSGFNQLDENRLKSAIDLKLKAMGFQLSETPSFRIDIQSAEIVPNNNSNVGFGLGGGGRNVGGGLSIGIPLGGNKPMKEIKIEFVDESKTGTFWEAVTAMSNPGNTPEKREASFVKLIEKVFAKYPPEQ